MQRNAFGSQRDSFDTVVDVAGVGAIEASFIRAPIVTALGTNAQVIAQLPDGRIVGVRQGNLMGPSGFLGLEDNEAMKFVQEGVRRSSTDKNVIMLDADNIGTSKGLISEAAIRAMYQYYRREMGF